MQQMKDFCPAQYYVQLFFLTKPKREKLSLILLDQVITQLFSWNAMTDVTFHASTTILICFSAGTIQPISIIFLDSFCKNSVLLISRYLKQF